MSYQYTGPQGQSYARSWGDDFTDQEKRNLQIGQYAPGPLPPLPDNNVDAIPWLQDLAFRSTGNIGGNTMAQDIDAGNIGAGSSPEALGFLKRVGNQLKELWNRPIMAPTITKPEHDLLIRGEGGGAHNWQN